MGCCSSSGPAPSASAASLAIRLWDPRVPTHPSLSSLSGSCWTSSANRNLRGRRPRADTAHSERSASWTRPRVSLSQPAEYLLRLAEPRWSRSRSLAVQRRQGRQLEAHRQRVRPGGGGGRPRSTAQRGRHDDQPVFGCAGGDPRTANGVDSDTGTRGALGSPSVTLAGRNCTRRSQPAGLPSWGTNQRRSQGVTPATT